MVYRDNRYTAGLKIEHRHWHAWVIRTTNLQTVGNDVALQQQEYLWDNHIHLTPETSITFELDAWSIPNVPARNPRVFPSKSPGPRIRWRKWWWQQTEAHKDKSGRWRWEGWGVIKKEVRAEGVFREVKAMIRRNPTWMIIQPKLHPAIMETKSNQNPPTMDKIC